MQKSQANFFEKICIKYLHLIKNIYEKMSKKDKIFWKEGKKTCSDHTWKDDSVIKIAEQIYVFSILYL